MQTSYNVQYARSLEGMAEAVHRSRRGLLPMLPQRTSITSANGAGTDDWEWTIVDDETGETHVLTATGSGTEATLAANAIAAFNAHDVLPMLFVLEGVTSASDVVATLRAKHSNRSYTVTATGGTGANTVAELQAAGGAGVNFGRMVCRATHTGAGPFEIQTLGASTELADLRGVVLRTDANSSRATETNSPTAEDLADRGKDLELLTEGYFLAKVEEAVSPGDPVHVRRALTSSAGRLGGFRASPAGATQVATITAVADRPAYVIEFGYLGQDYSFEYHPTDNTTTTDVAIDGLEFAAAQDGVLPDGVTASSASAAATMTLTAEAGTVFDYVRSVASGLDSAAVSATVSVAAGDADTLDISSIAQYETAASADGLALVKLNMK